MSNISLGQLIDELKKRDPNKVVSHGFGSGHSDRGDYCNVSFTPVGSTTFGAMLHEAELVLHTPLTGYKGGDFIMSERVDALIGEWGLCGENITRFNFLYWDGLEDLNEAADRVSEKDELLTKEDGDHLRSRLKEITELSTECFQLKQRNMELMADIELRKARNAELKKTIAGLQW